MKTKKVDKRLDVPFDELTWFAAPKLFKLLDKWKKERGYDPIKNPGARYHTSQIDSWCNDGKEEPSWGDYND